MFYLRWALTFISFPLGGWVAIEVVGPNTGILTAALGGAIVGAFVGVAQWLALRPRVRWRWILATSGAAAAGSALAAAATGASVSVFALAITGLITGAAVGATQGALIKGGIAAAITWAAVVATSWAAGWAITANVIVDAGRGYYIFGASGAVVVTLVTGVAWRWLMPAQGKPASPRLAAAR